MAGHRFFVSPAQISPNRALIEGDEAHHLRRVLRLTAGDEVRIFDGNGNEYLARIEQVNNQSAQLAILNQLTDEVESPISIRLVQGLIKGEKFDLVIQKAVELGICEFQPLESAHTDVQLSETRAEKRLERWQRIALEATKQSGRRKIMKVLPPIDFDDLLKDAAAPVIFFAERGGRPLTELKPQLAGTSLTNITAIVGSEGGWNSAELAAAEQAGFYLTTLGKRILRAETAGITAAVLLQNMFGDLS